MIVPIASIGEALPTIWSVVATIAAIATAYATLAALRLQRIRAQAKVIFTLTREGEKIIPELKNIGADVAREVWIDAKPQLIVAEDVDKHFKGYSRRVHAIESMHALLPGQSVVGEAFSVDAFRNQFTNVSTIEISVSYYSGNSKQRLKESWEITLSPLISYASPSNNAQS